MKILIRESKRDILAKQILNKKFPDLNVDVDYITDSTGRHRRIDYRNGDGVIMIYGERVSTLYICDDVVDGLEVLSYTTDKLKDVVGKWFSETFDLPVNIVRLVPKHSLN